jgi:sulfur carrier protein ThiS adenylyltransferase
MAADSEGAVGRWNEDLRRELASKNTPELNRKLPSATVGIAGVGGLGSNVAVALARVGVGRLVIADFDVVQPSNLNRQHFFLDDLGEPKVMALKRTIARINPSADVQEHRTRVTLENLRELFGGCDVLVEAFDTPEAKAMIVRAFLAGHMGATPLVCGSGLAGAASSNTIKTTLLGLNVYVCGDLESRPVDGRGLMAPRVMVAAGHQANMVVRLIAGERQP